jgi:hypothetical protein
MAIFAWIDQLIKNEERDHKPQSAKVSLRPIIKFIHLMNKGLLEVKIIIVAILIINNMNVDLPRQADLVIRQNQPYFEIDQLANQLLVDINEKIMMVDDQDQLEMLANHHIQNEELSDEWENLDTHNI